MSSRDQNTRVRVLQRKLKRKTQEMEKANNSLTHGVKLGARVLAYLRISTGGSKPHTALWRSHFSYSLSFLGYVFYLLCLTCNQAECSGLQRHWNSWIKNS